MRIVAMDGTPLAAPATAPAASDDLKCLRETLQLFQSRAAKWNQIYPKVTAEIDQILKPSLTQLEQTWAASVREWETQTQTYHAARQALQEALRNQRRKPELPVISHPPFWIRLWNYLNEPAIQTPPKSKHPESLN